MNAMGCILFAVCLLHVSIAYAETEDPVGDFWATRPTDMKGDESLMMFRVDLNGDGIGEVFLSQEKDTNGRLGNWWVVYISRGDKFARCHEYITLDHKSLVMMKSTVLGRDRLFSVTSVQKGELLLREVLVSETDIVFEKIATIILPEQEGERADIVLALLKNEDRSKPLVRKGKADELKQSITDESTSNARHQDMGKSGKSETPYLFRWAAGLGRLRALRLSFRHRWGVTRGWCRTWFCGRWLEVPSKGVEIGKRR
jgi:hypothetical protein